MQKPTRGLLAAALAVAILASVSPLAGAQDPSRDRGFQGRSRHLPALSAFANDALHRAFTRGRLTEAQYALERADTLFHLRRVRSEYGEVERPDPHAATLILRDLALRSSDMSGDDRRRAQAILARPDDANSEFGIPPYSHPKQTACSPTRGYCLHWAPPEDSNNAPDQTDTNPANGKPDFVDAAMTTMDTVWDDFKALGFKEPKKDGNSSPNKGPDNKTDVYLADAGSGGVYGYCTTDDPNASSGQYGYFDFSAYCVLDNDFNQQQFPGSTPPISNLQVTAAHEFFHAIQFAYDATEDGWLMEGTATSMEDVVYDDINDNLQFLLSSQFIDPAIPLDFSNPNMGSPTFSLRYGAFAFWRFMTEFLAPGPAQDDSVIRRIFERVDASEAEVATFNDEWSLKGAKNVAKNDYNVGFKKLFSYWGAALLLPEVFFEEGAEYVAFLQGQGKLGRAPLKKSATLDPNSPASKWYTTKLDHLAGRYYEFLPGGAVGPGDKLKVIVNGPKRKRGTNAVLVTLVGSDVVVQRLNLNKWGDGSLKVPFPDAAYLILQNASTRVRDCYSQFPNGFTSCAGIPRDDGLVFKGKGKWVAG